MMILRIARSPESSRSRFEITALRITGISFYLLTAGLVITAVLNIIRGARPETALSGLIISIILMVVASGWIAKMLEKYPSIQWIGLFVILFTALEMLEK